MTNTYIINVEHTEQDAMPDPTRFSPNSPAGQAPRAASRSEAEWARLPICGMAAASTVNRNRREMVELNAAWETPRDSGTPACDRSDKGVYEHVSVL